jgi:hypothetical protein
LLGARKRRETIAQDYIGQKVAEILKRKKARIKEARLPAGLSRLGRLHGDDVGAD